MFILNYLQIYTLLQQRVFFIDFIKLVIYKFIKNNVAWQKHNFVFGINRYLLSGAVIDDSIHWWPSSWFIKISHAYIVWARKLIILHIFIYILNSKLFWHWTFCSKNPGAQTEGADPSNKPSPVCQLNQQCNFLCHLILGRFYFMTGIHISDWLGLVAM